jgi:hypothetical protein
LKPLKIQFLVIFLLALLVRIIPFLFAAWSNESLFYLHDSYGYVQLAENILEHQVFSQYQDPKNLVSDAARTPIYPVFLSLFFLLKLPVKIIVLVQIVLGAITSWMVAKLVFKLTSHSKLAFFSGMIMAFDIPSIFSPILY